MRLLLSKFFVWLANLVPNVFFFRFIKTMLLYMAGVKLNPLAMYFLSEINMDRPWLVSFGKGVFVNRNCTFEGQGYISVGNNVQIGPNAVMATTNHQLGEMNEMFRDIKILDNVWVGANVVIVQGVTLGPNVIVGAGSVVTKSFSDCTIAGVPARVINNRKMGPTSDSDEQMEQ